MRKYSAVQAPVFAFFCADFFRDVRNNWQGTNLLYLLGMMVVVSAINSTHLYLLLSQFVSGPGETLIAKLPEASVQEGRLVMENPSPYVIENPWPTTEEETRIPLVVFDATGKIQTAEDHDALMIVTDKEFITKDMRSGKVQNIPLAQFEGLRLSPAGVRNKLREFAIWVPVAAFVLSAPLIWIGHAFQALLYGAVAVIIGQIVQHNMPFDAAMRLSIMAMTPAIIIGTILSILGQPNIFLALMSILGASSPAEAAPEDVQAILWGMISIVVVLGYLIFAVKVSASPSSPPSSASTGSANV